MQQSRHCEIVALASRRLAAAQQAAQQLGIPKSYGAYEELLNDPEVDAIYNPLPNHLHVAWSIKALEAGKHVLVEKPMATSTNELRQLLQAAAAHPRLKIMEAFMYRQHPQWQTARELAHSGKIGTVRALHTSISFFNISADNVRNQADKGGGALLDIGCYAVSFARFIFGAEPVRACALMEHDPNFKIDRLISGILDFGSQVSTFMCSMQLARHQSVIVLGTEGKILLETPVNPPWDLPGKIFLQRNDVLEEIPLAACNQFTLQGDAFSLAILNDTPVPVSAEDSLANMRAIEALSEGARANSWIAVSAGGQAAI
jgi:predicted dehydrogenase